MSDAVKVLLGSCSICTINITIDDPYVEIMHYRPYPQKTTRQFFCEECFYAIAGEEYSK